MRRSTWCVVALVAVLLGAFAPPAAAQFPPLGDDMTTSLGTFTIVVAPPFRPLFVGYPGYNPVTFELTSPTLFDPATLIGRSSPHTHGAPVDNAGTPTGVVAPAPVSDGMMGLIPASFLPLPPPPSVIREVHTKITTLNMTHASGVAVRAGTLAAAQPVSPGEVESLDPAGIPANDFPAESFFDIFVEVDLPAAGAIPAFMLYNSTPLMVFNPMLPMFPPTVVYIHGNSNAVPVLFRTPNPGTWAVNDVFGWMVLAGHGVGFGSDPMSIQRFQQIMGMAPRMPLISLDCVKDKDYVVSGSNVNPNNSGLYSNVYCIDRNNNATTILWTPRTSLATLPATTNPNWVTMARNNRDMIVGLTAASPIGLTYITPQGGLRTFTTTPAPGRIDDIDLRDNGTLVIAGSGIGGPILATNDNGGAITTLVAITPGGTLNGAENEDNGLWAFQIQALSPGGGLAEYDLVAGVQTRIIATGLSFVNTVAYRVADGHWYCTEFDQTGAAAGTVYRITNAGAVTTLATGPSIDRTNSVDIDQEGHLLIVSRHNRLRMDPSGAILETVPFDYERLRASSGGIVYGGNRLQFNYQGTSVPPGGVVNMRLAFRGANHPGATYVGAFSTTARPGLTLPNGEQLNLNPGDPLFFASLTGLFDAIFPGRSGMLNSSGEANAQLLIPGSLPPGLNLRIFVAFVAVAGTQISATETEGFTIN